VGLSQRPSSTALGNERQGAFARVLTICKILKLQLEDVLRPRKGKGWVLGLDRSGEVKLRGPGMRDGRSPGLRRVGGPVITGGATAAR